MWVLPVDCWAFPETHPPTGSLPLAGHYNYPQAWLYRRGLCLPKTREKVSALIFESSRNDADTDTIAVRVLSICLYILEALTCPSVTIASRTCLIGADLIVIGVTWHATYRTTQIARAAGLGQQSMRTFSGTLLRDGTSVCTPH